MSTQHPITSPEELVATLRNSAPHHLQVARETWIITHAYAAGAERMLKACCAWLVSNYSTTVSADELCAAMSPKPLSLKDASLAVLDDCSKHLNAAHENVLRRALEALPDDD